MNWSGDNWRNTKCSKVYSGIKLMSNQNLFIMLISVQVRTYSRIIFLRCYGFEMTYRYTLVRLNPWLQKSDFCVFAKHHCSKKKNQDFYKIFSKFTTHMNPEFTRTTVIKPLFSCEPLFSGKITVIHPDQNPTQMTKWLNEFLI